MENKKYGFSIEPFYNMVRAEIYKINNYEALSKPVHISKIHKDFGSFWRKPIEKDYKKAREWVDLQIKCIETYNK